MASPSDPQPARLAGERRVRRTDPVSCSTPAWRKTSRSVCRAEQSEADRLQRALVAAGLEELACTLPDGVWTGLGERGARLSGGQRQRIGIARALYRDSSVLVLDEATAGLDGIAERELVRTLAKLRPEFVTVIAIAHRMASVRDCDMIYEIDQGRVVDAGSFDELVRR